MSLASVSLLGQIALDCFMSRWCGGYCQPSTRFSHPQVIVPLVCFSYPYTFGIRSRFPCRVNSGGHVKRSKYIDISAVLMEKLYFSECNVISHLRRFLQKIRNYQPVSMCFCLFIQLAKCQSVLYC